MKLELLRSRTALLHLRWWWSDVCLLFRRTFEEFIDDRCLHVAAGISYYVMFSLFPLAILAVAVAGKILSDEALRAEVVSELLRAVPLLPGQGRRELLGIIEGVVEGSSVSGVAGALGLLWSASAVMSSLRYALGEAWDSRDQRPFLHGKLVDALMLLGLGGLLTLSVGLTVVLRGARGLGERAAAVLGPIGAGAQALFEATVVVVPFGLSFLTFLLVYRVLPSVRTRVRDIWPGALFATVLFEIAKIGFATYLRYFGQYDRVYGSLGAVMAFLFFVYIGANVLLLGAEMAAEWPRVLNGLYDEEAGRDQGAPLRRRLVSALSGLVRKDGTSGEEEEPAPDTRAARRRRREQGS